jgi:hypothetical protein
LRLFKGTRRPVKALFENLEEGASSSFEGSTEKIGGEKFRSYRPKNGIDEGPIQAGSLCYIALRSIER